MNHVGAERRWVAIFLKKKRKKKDKAISNLTEATNCVNVFGTSEKIILLSLIRQITSLNQPDQMLLTCAVLSLHS